VGAVADGPDDENPVFRRGGVSYLRIPAPDPRGLADFYRAVFDWEIHGRDERPGFHDGSGHVIGHFVADAEVAGEAGMRPYVFVEGVDEILERVRAAGGRTATAPYPEGELRIATFADPAGNIIGVWELAASTRQQAESP
jgi:uncharacterized protein